MYLSEKSDRQRLDGSPLKPGVVNRKFTPTCESSITSCFNSYSLLSPSALPSIDISLIPFDRYLALNSIDFPSGDWQLTIFAHVGHGQFIYFTPNMDRLFALDRQKFHSHPSPYYVKSMEPVAVLNAPISTACLTSMADRIFS